MSPTIDYSCKSKKNRNFCYVCANYVLVKNRNDFSKDQQKLYCSVFNVKCCKNLNKWWSPKILCKSCLNNMVKHDSGKRMLTHSPAIWHQPKDKHHADCYICQTELTPAQKK